MAHPYEDLLRKGYEAATALDIETASEVLADDVVFHVPGNGPISGDYEGRDAVLGFFAKNHELSGGTSTIEIHDVAVTDDHAVVLQVNRAERNGKTLEARAVGVYHIRDGKAVEAWFFTNTQDENDRFWS
jgi:hypothetical protein